MSRLLILARHGATRSGDDRTYLGQTDVPLGAEGERQARRLGRSIAAVPLDAVFSSDLARCRRTAEIALEGRDIEIAARPALREVAMGDWEGRSRADIAEAFPEEYRARGADFENFRVNRGESFRDCSERAVAAVHDIVASSRGNVLIVAHANVNRLLLCHVLGMPIANLFRLSQDFGCLNILSLDRTGYRLMLLNFIPNDAAPGLLLHNKFIGEPRNQ